MSVAVDLAALKGQVSRFGASALLVTTSAGGPPHISSVLVAFDGDELAMNAGRKTRANVAEHPAVAIVWPGGSGDDDYCLIVDGRAGEGPADTLVVRPTSAVLHRLASAPSELAQCVAVDGSQVAPEPSP